jgi:hypothetical protein
MVGRIAMGEVEDTKTEKNPHAVALGKAGGAKGGNASKRSSRTSGKRCLKPLNLAPFTPVTGV